MVFKARYLLSMVLFFVLAFTHLPADISALEKTPAVQTAQTISGRVTGSAGNAVTGVTISATTNTLKG